MYQKLNLTAERIEQVLRERNVPASVVGGRVLPAFVELLLHPEGGTRVSQVRALQADIALAVGNANIRIAQSGSHLAIQIGRESRQPVSLRALMLRMAKEHAPRFTSVLGLNEDGSILMTRWSAPDVPHALISATTGGGKTTLAQIVLVSLVTTHRPYELGVVLIDPKAAGRTSGFVRAMERHLLLPPAVSVDDAAAALGKVAEVMERRAQLRDPLPRIMVYVDELADLVEQGGPVILGPLTRLAQMGREAGIHLVVCTQKPSSKLIGPLLKANIPLRLVGRVTSVEDARVASGMPACGAEKLAGAGDFIAVAGGGRTIRFQAPINDYVPDISVPQQAVSLTANAPTLQSAAPSYDESEPLQEVESWLPATRTELHRVSLPASTATAMPLTMASLRSEGNADPQEDEHMQAESDEDIACMQRLAAANRGALPGVSVWANERFRDRGWGVPYAGDRCKWMRPRWEMARSAVERSAAR